MAEVIVQQTDLSAILSHLSTINGNIQQVYNNVDNVRNNVTIVYSELANLAKEFESFVNIQIRANRLGQAETRLVKIRQELDKKYGHYDIVRRTTTGILQADDLGIIKKETINNITEELMVSTPNYWLTPCLVALSAWFSDNQQLAEKALREGIKRDDEKASLFFSLVCRRADRMDGCLKWIQRYLANLDEEALDRKTIVILDAYAGGLLGVDSEGAVASQIALWLENLTAKPGFVEKQIEQWSDAIRLKRTPIDSNYTYLEQYSHTWPQMKDVLEGANLHRNILNYFSDIFEKEGSAYAVKRQLDDILTHLVSDFDDEELPLRREERLEQFVVDFRGDEKSALEKMKLEQSALEEHKDFTQLLTDAAMKPESSGAGISAQKFAIALTRDWIITAYNDITAQNRMKIPDEIEINVDTFNGITHDGENEDQLIYDFNQLVDDEMDEELSKHVMSLFDKFCFYGGVAVAVIALFMIITGSKWTGALAGIAAIGMLLRYYGIKKQITIVRDAIERKYEEKRTKGSDIIRATLAEAVDFRYEFTEKDSESVKVIDFLSQITPEQYLRRLSGAKRIRV